MLFTINIILDENPVPIRERIPGLEKEIVSVIDKVLLKIRRIVFLMQVNY